MSRGEQRAIRSDIAWSTPDRIGVLGHDLVRELIGRVDLGDMGFLEITGRLPNARESAMFNALLVTLVEHGIVPSTLATRMTVAGAPEALQAAVAAGLLGLGSVFVGSTEAAARLLKDALPDPSADVSLKAVAERIVEQHREQRRILPGLGHPIHKPIDPRTPRLFAIARAQGFAGRYIELMKAIARRAERVHQRPLPINATGAIGAIACEMGLPWQACRGIGVMARAVGLVGHALEELRQPLATAVWHRTEAEATAATRGRLRPGKASRAGPRKR
ncbi:MAG: citryl-CoA lyase [Burkholderiaceae bacterium]